MAKRKAAKKGEIGQAEQTQTSAVCLSTDLSSLASTVNCSSMKNGKKRVVEKWHKERDEDAIVSPVCHRTMTD